MVLFPDVLTLLGQNMEWTTELGKAFISDQKAVLDSVQRLRAQAQAAGNLKTTPQQEVTTETQNGQTVIIVQPANPQIVYIPVYNPQVVYVAAPPAQSNVAAAAAIGFMAGIVLGAAMSSSYGYYGWVRGACTGTRASSWCTGARGINPPGATSTRGRACYRPPYNVAAPRYNNVNVNINNTTINNVNRQNPNTSGRTPRPTTYSAGPATPGQTAAPSWCGPRRRPMLPRAGAHKPPPRAPRPARQPQRPRCSAARAPVRSGGIGRGATRRPRFPRGRTSAAPKSNRKK